MSKDYPTTALTMDQKYRLKAQVDLSGFLFRDLTLTFLPPPGSILRDLTVGGDNMTDFFRRQFFTLISIISQLPIPTIKVTEDVEIITEKPAPTGSGYRESTPLSDMDETII